MIPAATAPEKDQELQLTIALLNVFTIVQMVVWPYVGWAAGMTRMVAGAWFGGSIDGTGNVVAAAAIFDELDGGGNRTADSDDSVAGWDDDGFSAVDVASTVKMLQNSLIGPVAIAVTVYWIRV